ncbi:TlpA disulfide reductase family protein [Urechidicola croceus]|uniref:Alkyl hydroperoxide reductase n=1 Tax=Urechidicola croceus TaxID=1850246 RepID=A0A1D8PAZ9_9FLAO|nr:TlpA disulfide reductase family protein [Urechidicola croceus]AOW21736.1 alkyl hydroperoxide reductase [Urechidicola croceus]
MRKANYITILFLVITSLLSCKKDTEISELKTGFWRGEITIQNQQLPFIFEVLKDSEKFKINLHDGDNIIEIDEISIQNDSVLFPLHIFDIDIKAKINNESLSGTYTKNYADDYILPFKATYGKKERVDNYSANKKFDGKWSFKFENDDENNKKVALFKSENNKLKGTVMTKTGDYRFLEGFTNDDKFTLYAFDGNHLYIFKAELENDSILKGEQWSGKTAHRKFTAIKDENAELPDANKLTFLKEGFDKIEFSFPDLEGNKVTLNDSKYKNKAVILQLFGTWCPNCMDETKFYTEWYDKNKDRGVEIIGLAYEVKDDFEYAKTRVQKMIEKYNINYDFLIAGTSTSGEAGKSLPMLNHVMSFPTSIIIDKNGKVRNIHTGFSGPATGDYYLDYVREFNSIMDEILSEN